MARTNSNSPSVSGQKSEISSTTPCPASATPRAMASSSSVPARSEGVGSPLAVRWFRVRDVEKPMAPSRRASVARRAHGGAVLGRRLLEPGRPLAHDVEAQRAVGELRAQVDVVRPALDRVEVLAEALPGPVDPLVEHGTRDVLHPLHQRDQARVRVGPHRREAHAAVAHDGGRDAVPARRRHALVPGRLPVVVRVDVDEARRDQQTVGVHLLGAPARHRPHGGDRPAVHRHVGPPGLAALPVGHQAAPDHEVVRRVCHALPLTLPRSRGDS